MSVEYEIEIVDAPMTAGALNERGAEGWIMCGIAPIVVQKNVITMKTGPRPGLAYHFWRARVPDRQ